MKLIFKVSPQAIKTCVLGSRSKASAVVSRGGSILGSTVAMAMFLFVGLFGPVAAHAQTTPSIVAVAESGTATMGTASTPIANVAANDTINGLPATLGAGGNATVAEFGTWPTGITLKTTTGAITTTATVPAGVYNVTYQLCDRNSPANCNTATNVITVNALATLTITKLAVNGGAAFPFTVSGGLTASFNLNPNPPSTPTQSQTFTNVPPGQAITITEYEPTTPGFDLADITCSNANGTPTGSTVSTSITNTTGQQSGTATVNLVPGANLTCTFTNLKNPSIVIVKEAIGGDNTFNFAVSATAGTVADPSINITTSAGVGAFKTSVKLTGGVTTTTATLTESTPPAGYVLTAIACTNMTTGATVGTVTLASRQVVLTGLVAASEINCKFTNETRRLTLRKTWVNGRIGDAITVTTTGGSANATVTSTSTGNNTTTGTAVNVNTGSITLPTESFTTGNQSNYASTVSCTGNATPLAGSTLPQTLTIGATDTNVVCTYTNTGLADMHPTFGTLPTAFGPGGTVTGLTLTCANAGPASATSATCAPSASAGAISNLSCSTTLPATVAAGASVICTFSYTAPGVQGGSDTSATTITFTGTTGATNDSNGGTGTGGNNTTTSTARSIIDALNDTFGPIDSGTGGTTASVLANDTNGAAAATTANVTITNLASGTFPAGGSALSVNTATGQITVPVNAVPGTYTVPYQICANPAASPVACDTASATVTVASIHAQNDTFAVSPDVATGATTASVVANDTVNGAPVTLGTNATLYASGTAHNGTTTLGLSSTPAQGGITMNADGTIHVAPNTTQGTYNYVYEICVFPAATPAICATGTATITVNATVPITLASVDARQDSSGLSVAWTTATETRNAGFHLYGRMTGASDWLPLTATLVPSQVIDSLEPQRYTATFPGVAVDELLIEDWDTQGQTQRHGPFAVGRQHGFDAVTAAKSLDWATIHAENTQTTRQTQEKALSVAGAPDALLWVTEPGVQRVSFDELQAAGARFSGVAIADLALTDAGKKYPRYVIDGNGNGQFDSGDSVEFLGEVTSTLYSARNAYRLLVDRSRVNDANSKALDLKNAVSGVFNDEIKVEQQRAYSFAAPGSDPWYDQWLFAYTSPVSLERTFDLPGYAGGEARLTLRHWGVTDWPGNTPDHHLIVKVNGQQLDEAWFDGSVDASRTLVLPQGLAQATGNTLTLIAPGDTGYQYDIQALDNFSVQYPRHTQAYAGAWRGEPSSDAKTLITGFQGESVAWRNAQRRVGAEQLVVNGQGPWIAADSRAIHRPTLQVDIPTPVAEPTAKAVDYLIISHPLFVDSSAMTDLVALQQGRGYRTAVVDVDTIYAAYSDFEVSADAISRYLKQAKPRFVLLVGGDSYDYHDYLKLASQSFMPTHYAQTDALITYAPADGRYVDYNNDGKPQAALGRLPARTVAELTQVVAKLKDHVPPTHAVLGAGPSDGGSHQFATISEGYAAQLPSTWTRQLVAVDDLGLAAAQSALQTELNGDNALVSYMGHSSYAIWGLNPSSGILLSATQTRQLSNSTPHLVTQWGCWNTYFVNPKQDTMANAFLFQSHGAAAVLGATALTDINVLSGLGNAFFKQLGQSATLGEALQAAQRTYLNQNPAAASRLRGFALLGDPAAEVR